MVEEKEQTNKYRNSVKKRRKGSSSTQTKECTSERNFPDLISALPDSLLLDILSLLDMKDVMGTSLLSKRWRYLWKFIPCLCFKRFSGRELTNFIDRCLFHHEGSKIRKLDINFSYGEDRHALLVDSWIHFAIRRKVEDIKLQPFCLDPYKLPRSLYFCETLTSLTLSSCNLNLPQSFQLGSLKKLSLQLLELSSDSIEHLSSSCPLLEEIYLMYCNSGQDLDIVITNQHVKRLKISGCGQCEPCTTKINAPTLLSLGIYQCDPYVRVHVEELGSLISAEIIGDEALIYEYCKVADGDETNYLEGLLYDLRHVRRLKLCCCFLQVLSVLSIRKVFTLGPFSISATSVELQTTLTKWELPGISYLLKNCSNLENLEVSREGNSSMIISQYFIDDYDFEEEGYWESVGIALPSILQHIKIIKLNGYGCSNKAFV